MNLIARAKAILVTPKQEWAVIDSEPFDQTAVLTGYVLPLAAIGPIASFIGWTTFGILGFRLPVGSALTGAITAFVLAVLGVFVIAWVANALAPNFGGQQSFGQAFKLAAYSSTAAWVGGIFALIPALAIVGSLFGLYSLYLCYLGIPVLMKAPPDKAVTYTVAVILVIIVVFFAAALISSGMR